MKISTLLITSAIALSVSSASFAGKNTKLCVYSNCEATSNDSTYTCSQIVNSDALSPALEFTPNENQRGYSVSGTATHHNANCSTGKASTTCRLRINSSDPCSLQ